MNQLICLNNTSPAPPRRWRIAWVTLLLALLLPAASATADERVRLAVFDVDATPPLGAPMAYGPVTGPAELTLRCRGIALLGAGEPVVLCAVDWIGIANEGHDAFREALAEAAGTVPARVAVHAVHQHDAPGCDFTAERLIAELGIEGYSRFEGEFHREVIRRAADALRRGIAEAREVTHWGWGEAEVREVASNRRLLGDDGRVRATRFTATRDPALRAEPEGLIDPLVTALSFWQDDTPLAILTSYACHPQSYYRMGVPHPDFPGIARFIRAQSLPHTLHVHFMGAGGDVGAGKYNDGSWDNRMVLAGRLADGMAEAFEKTEKHPLTAGDIGWGLVRVGLPLAPHLDRDDLVAKLRDTPPQGYISYADQLAWLTRREAGHKIDVTCLRIGDSRMLHLPGELLVAYQLAAAAMRPDLHVMVAAYGDYGPGYIGTAESYEQGGYETSERASGVAPGVEEVLLDAIRELLEAPAADDAQGASLEP